MRKYAEENADEWFILSAEHGLLTRDQVIEPYERTLNTMPKQLRLAWAAKVNRRLLEVLPVAASIIVLAGERYRENIVPFLKEHARAVEIPMLGLSMGRQLRWLKEHSRNG